MLGLVADDLTGAADSAAGFAERGWEVTLHLRPEGLTAAAAAAPTVLAVTTGSRAMPDDEAAKATATAVDALAAAGAERLFLKVDSTVRGSVAGQLTGALTAWSRRYPEAAAVICPAFPSQGRTVVASTVLVNGVPVGETAAAADPVTPQTLSDLTQIIPGSVPGEPGDRASRLIVDAATDTDLDSIAAQLAAAGPELIMVGSGGLAAAARPGLVTDRHSADDPGAAGRILIAISSLHPVTVGQLSRLDPAIGVDVLTTARGTHHPNRGRQTSSPNGSPRPSPSTRTARSSWSAVTEPRPSSTASAPTVSSSTAPSSSVVPPGSCTAVPLTVSAWSPSPAGSATPTLSRPSPPGSAPVPDFDHHHAVPRLVEKETP